MNSNGESAQTHAILLKYNRIAPPKGKKRTVFSGLTDNLNRLIFIEVDA